ncbi:hypothetical protein ACFL35_02195 [Candidatus Riflebacteria bacterium]
MQMIPKGIKKAAIITVFLGEEVGQTVFETLPSRHRKLLTKAIRRLRKITPGEKKEVLLEFESLIMTSQFLEYGGPEYAKKLLKKSFSAAEVEDLFQGVYQQKSSKGYPQSHFKAQPQRTGFFKLLDYQETQHELEFKLSEREIIFDSEKVEDLIKNVDQKTLCAAIYGLDFKLREEFLNFVPHRLSQQFLDEAIANAPYEPCHIAKALEIFYKNLE